LYSPTSGALHTLQQKEPTNTKHQRNQDYSLLKLSDNEDSVVLFFRASPSAFAPSAPILLPTDTPEWRDPKTNSANQFQWATLSTGNRNNRTRYMVVLIVPLYNRTLDSPTSGALTNTHLNKRNPETQITSETKNTHLPNPAPTKSAWCCPSERHPAPSLLLRRFHCLQTHPSGEIQIPIQQTSYNGRRSQQAITTSALNT
jgi:hypothetical protein